MDKTELMEMKERLACAGINYVITEHSNGYLDLSYLSAVGNEIVVEFRPNGSLIE